LLSLAKTFIASQSLASKRTSKQASKERKIAFHFFHYEHFNALRFRAFSFPFETLFNGFHLGEKFVAE